MGDEQGARVLGHDSGFGGGAGILLPIVDVLALVPHQQCQTTRVGRPRLLLC
jgi:hypothetical protein